MPPVILALEAVAAVAGIAEIAHGFSSTPKEPDKAALPDQKTADASATNTVANQRQILLASGGQTDYTGGLGTLLGSDVAKSTLIGG